jgi:hypothetical protein
MTGFFSHASYMRLAIASIVGRFASKTSSNGTPGLPANRLCGGRDFAEHNLAGLGVAHHERYGTVS